MIEVAKFMILVIAAEYLILGVILCVGGNWPIGTSYVSYAVANIAIYFAV